MAVDDGGAVSLGRFQLDFYAEAIGNRNRSQSCDLTGARLYLSALWRSRPFDDEMTDLVAHEHADAPHSHSRAVDVESWQVDRCSGLGRRANRIACRSDQSSHESGGSSFPSSPELVRQFPSFVRPGLAS